MYFHEIMCTTFLRDSRAETVNEELCSQTELIKFGLSCDHASYRFINSRITLAIL